MEYPWAAEVKAVEKGYKTSLKKGLSSKAVEAKREEHGWNELEQEEGSSFWDMVLEQFDDPLVKILLLAAVVSAAIAVHELHEQGMSFSIGHFVEPLVILLILFLNAAVGVYQESNAEKSLEALKEMQPDKCRALRDGVSKEIDARELVPGDVVECRVGDKVPADLRVAELKTTTLRLEQMTLTGESVSVAKQDEPIRSKDCEIQKKSSMMFAGTTIANGTVIGIVTHIGMGTEVGKIQEQLQAAAAERAEEKTPLKQKLEDFSDQLQNIILFICAAVWLINIRMFVNFDNGLAWDMVDFKKAIYYFQIAVALAVAAVPEGLPTVITMCLALGTRKMAKRNAIVRKLPAVETLGCTSVICSDKTGTLTTNQMSVRALVTCGRNDSDLVEAEVTGSTYNPADGEVTLGKGGLTYAVRKLAQICSLCNESTVELNKAKGVWRHVGAPTEAALTVVVEKLLQEGAASATPMNPDPGANSDVPCNERLKAACPTVATLEFTRDRKSMSVLVNPGGSNELLVKGAPESLLERCTHVLVADGKRIPLTATGRKALEREITKFAGRALRCLGFAYSDSLGTLADYDGPHHNAAKKLKDPETFVDVEQNLTWVGIVAMQDPPRKEVHASMLACRDAGIRVIVITGDNKITAEAICRDIGVFTPDEDISNKSFVGHDFSKLSKDRQNEILSKDPMGGLVFSRAEPKFKQDIVRLLQLQNCVVAMTGDGVNDAPALKMADIGIAMGISGTEVAKEASDFVLADDNFSTIVGAVEEGRSIAENMAAFVRYMISSNVGEVFSIFFVAALGLPEGMVPVQLLWVNLVTDGPPATALGFNRADPGIMTKPPRDKNEPLINNWVLFRYLVVGAYVGFATVGAFVAWFMHGVGSQPFLGLVDLSQDGHTSVTFEQLTNWDKCDLETNMFHLGDGAPQKFFANDWTAGGITYTINGCDYFGEEGKAKASTLSLTVLVTIEMFNALNALSENGSLLYHVLPWDNIYLLLAMGLSFVLHAVILYVPALCPVFQVVPLSVNEWLLVILFSAPVVLIEEVLKIWGRGMEAKERAIREKAWNERIGKKTN